MRYVDAEQVKELARTYGTPLYAYDAGLIRDRIQQLSGFDVLRFAQKACSNVHILRLMRAEGVLVDAVSLGELERAVRAGYTGEGDRPGVVYTADIVTEKALDRIVELDVPLNAGSTDSLEQLGRRMPGHRVWLRVNPGFGHGHSRKTNTGGEWSKHGIWYQHLDEAVRQIEKYSLDLQGLHMHIGSGTDLEHLKRVCEAMVEQVRALNLDLRAISAGGGLPISYRESDPPLDTQALFLLWHAARKRIEASLGHAVSLELEPGRYLVGEAGILVAEVRATKRMGPNRFVLVDAGFDNLMRPAMYGSYHAISVVTRAGALATGPTEPTVVGGPLCESGDVFTQGDGGEVVPRDLPGAAVGDLVVLHDAGAYAASMASNYNSRPLAPEVLIDGRDVRLIRRRQTIEDLLSLEDV